MALKTYIINNQTILHNQTLSPNYIIKAQKAFHYSNLLLQLIYDSYLDIYIINIHRVNDSTDSDIFGLFTTLKQATTKFNSITL